MSYFERDDCSCILCGKPDVQTRTITTENTKRALTSCCNRCWGWLEEHFLNKYRAKIERQFQDTIQKERCALRNTLAVALQARDRYEAERNTLREQVKELIVGVFGTK